MRSFAPDDKWSEHVACQCMVTGGGCSCAGFVRSADGKLDTYNWVSPLWDVEEPAVPPLVEVKFKGTRKGLYRNLPQLPLKEGMMVVVRGAMDGWDMGLVTLTGVAAERQRQVKKVKPTDIGEVLRLPTQRDQSIYRKAKAREPEMFFKAREVIRRMELPMKLSSVEMQADNSKGTFYFTADNRVDFRALVRELARMFHIKVEMRQIGVRQEAGLIGAVGDCGRELCCSTWLTSFRSITAKMARHQELVVNIEKLTGMCGRLKCCLDYELSQYLEEVQKFPPENTLIETERGTLQIVKFDILGHRVWLNYKDPSKRGSPLIIPLATVHKMIEINKSGKVVREVDDFSFTAVS